MLPQRLQGMGREYTIAPYSMSGAQNTFLHLVQMNIVFPRTMVIVCKVTFPYSQSSSSIILIAGSHPAFAAL